MNGTQHVQREVHSVYSAGKDISITKISFFKFQFKFLYNLLVICNQHFLLSIATMYYREKCDQNRFAN